MKPISPKQILRNLEHGYFMTHQEQNEAAQYIRQLQQENLTMLGKNEQDWSLLAATQESLREHMARIKELESKLKEKNGAL